MLRIWPLYFFCIGLALVPALNLVHSFSWRYVAAFLLLAGNWSIVAWGWPIHSIISPLWTVSIEEQFYQLWPPIVGTLSRKRIILAAIAMLILSNLARVLLVASGPPARPHAQAQSCLQTGDAVHWYCGAQLVANYWRTNASESLQWVPTLAGFPLVTASCTLIMIAVLGVSFHLPQWLVYLGISYGLYVYHALGMVLTDKSMPTHTHSRQLVLRETIALAATVSLASASYALLEKPFLRIKKRFQLIGSRPV